MSFHDPYKQAAHSQHQPGYDEHTSEFNPYTTDAPHQTYEQGLGSSYEPYHGYSDEPQYATHYPPNRSKSQRVTNEQNGFKDETFSRKAGLGEKTPRSLRHYRYENQGALWTKGSRPRCIGRFCCCTLMIAILLFLCIVLSLALWIRPPNIVIGQVEPRALDGSVIVPQANGISINLGVNISVDNPNYFDVNFKEIKAEIFYPINNTEVGEGDSKNVVFKANQLTNWTFPFTLDYRTTSDPQGLIVRDIATKCGVLGTKSNINVNYRITPSIRILFITVSPVISNSMSFSCPLDASELEPLLGAFGISL